MYYHLSVQRKLRLSTAVAISTLLERAIDWVQFLSRFWILIFCWSVVFCCIISFRWLWILMTDGIICGKESMRSQWLNFLHTAMLRGSKPWAYFYNFQNINKTSIRVHLSVPFIISQQQKSELHNIPFNSLKFLFFQSLALMEEWFWSLWMEYNL